ncbi:hypothetical protein KI387_023297, partial [Taxus chinensis]
MLPVGRIDKWPLCSYTSAFRGSDVASREDCNAFGVTTRVRDGLPLMHLSWGRVRDENSMQQGANVELSKLDDTQIFSRSVDGPFNIQNEQNIGIMVKHEIEHVSEWS